MHLLWINQQASLAGGCEHYVFNTAGLLARHGIRSSLLYDPRARATPEFLQGFAGAFPWVGAADQIRALRPDLVYVHQWNPAGDLEAIRQTGLPAARFLHDHKLFCLREYKYTTLRHRTCTRRVGWACYPCLGFVRRSTRWPGLSLLSVGQLRQQQMASRFFHACVVGSRYMAEEARRHGFAPARVRVIPLYANPPADRPAPARDFSTMLFVGQLLRGKGLDVLLAAMARTRHPVQLVVAGAGKQKAMFQGICRRLGLENRVTFAGWQSSRELAALYAKTGFLVVPSRGPETFGLVGLEAHSHGTAVIATNIGGVAEWLEHEQTGLAVPPNHPAALARAIDRLSQDPDLARRLGAEGRRRYQAKFLPEHHAERLLKLFASLLKPRQPA